MILVEPFPSPVENADVQEAHSIRYGPTAFMIVPLQSGRVAVLGHMRDLHAICDTLDEVIVASQTIPFLVWRRAAAEPKPRPDVAKALAGLNLGELDL